MGDHGIVVIRVETDLVGRLCCLVSLSEHHLASEMTVLSGSDHLFDDWQGLGWYFVPFSVRCCDIIVGQVFVRVLLEECNVVEVELG